jgi:cytochrome P450 family 82 subfamily G polypeptide 1
MKRVAKELDHVVSGWLVEHLQRREEGRVRKEEKDFMDVMLESLAVGDDPIFGYKRETIVKATALVSELTTFCITSSSTLLHF